MVDEILHQFLDELFGKYREIVAAGLDSRATLEALVVTSYEAIDASHSAVAIYQDEVKHHARHRVGRGSLVPTGWIPLGARRRGSISRDRARRALRSGHNFRRYC